MQTFLPYPDFAECASVLDNQRLNKQITECKQIAMAITGESDGWRNHPAVKMWREHLDELMSYGLVMYVEWQRRFDEGKRGGTRKHAAGEWIPVDTSFYLSHNIPWLTPAVCSAYRALLLAKDPVHYGQFNWPEQPNPDSARIFEMIKGEMENAR